MKYIYSILIVLTAISCTKNVDYLLENAESRPVLNSIMSPDSVITAYLAYSTQTQTQEVSYIDNALVLLYCDETLIDTLILNFFENGKLNIHRYESTYKPIAGKKYKILARLNDGTEIFGETIIPEKPLPCNPLIDTNLIYVDQTYYANLELTIHDYSLDKDYFEFVFYEYNYYLQRITSVSDYMSSNFYKIDNVVLNEGDWGFEPRTVFFSDELFNGKTYSFNGYIIEGKGYWAQKLDTNSLSETDKFMRFNHVSYDYFKYKKSYTRHHYNSNIQTDGVYNLIYIGNPVEMYSNVTGGYGIVASYNSIDEIIIPKL